MANIGDRGKPFPPRFGRKKLEECAPHVRIVRQLDNDSIGIRTSLPSNTTLFIHGITDVDFDGAEGEQPFYERGCVSGRIEAICGQSTLVLV